MKKSISFAALAAVFCLLFASGSRQALANSFTMTLSGTGSESAGGAYIYPYYFTIQSGGSTYTNVELMCINFNREIFVGESWTANEVTAGSQGISFEEAAYLYSQAASATTANARADAQWAAWYLFDPAIGATDPEDGSSSNVTNLLATAASEASLYANYDVYLPVAGSQPWGDDVPQIFIGDGEPPYVPTPAPEPSGFLLLGTGLFGLASMLYYRKRGVLQAGQL
ncbi:MAG TPA: hypothetical protein VGG56_13910 [Terracidiphilus sp.]